MKTHPALNDFLLSLPAGTSTITIAWYRQKINRFGDACPELPEDPGPIEDFLANRQGTSETKHAYFRALKAFFTFVSDRYDLLNPMRKVIPPRCPKKIMATLEPHELMALLHSTTNLRDRALLTLLIDTGMRTTELAGLRKRDIKTSTVIVRGKTGEREIPIMDETKRLLLALAPTGSGDQHIFRGYKGPLNRHSIY